MSNHLTFAALALAALAATPALAAPAGCVKPETTNAVTVTAPGSSPVVGVAIVGTGKNKDAGVLPGDGAGTTVADASDRCPAGYVQQYVQQPSTRPIQYREAATVAAVVTASPDAPARPPKN
jgi:hypothetical protein